MDVLPILVTGLSVAAAAGMAMLLLRLLRDERQRSAARIAALAALAGDPAPDDPFESPSSTVAPVPEGSSAPALFAAPEGDARLWPRLAVAGGMGVLVLAAYIAAGGGGDRPSAAAAPTRATVPLELLSLRYEADTGGSTVSGVVFNPRNGRTATGVQVSAFLLGADGGVLASARAPLDFLRLSPGDESPFVVRVPHEPGASVVRYRIGFREADGRVISHVDRRGAERMARQERSR